MSLVEALQWLKTSPYIYCAHLENIHFPRSLFLRHRFWLLGCPSRRRDLELAYGYELFPTRKSWNLYFSSRNKNKILQEQQPHGG
jgi:hypothetical protein